MSAILTLSLPLMMSAQAAQVDAQQLRASLLQRFDEVTDQQGLDAQQRGPCLTGLVTDLRDNWEIFEPSDQQRMASFLAPWGGGDLSPRNLRPHSDEPPPPPPADRDEPCFGHQSQHTLLTDHFSIEWDAGVDDDLAEAFAEALEYSWDKEVIEYGWNRPVGTDEYPMLAYISDNDNYAGAYTSVEYCSGEGYVPYIVAYSGSWSSPTWADDMAAHEFAHAIQFSTSYAPEFWYWEATAIWMEEQVYPNSNYWSYYVDAYTQNPWIGLTAQSQRDQEIFYHMYGGAIFNFFLDNWYEGHATVKGMWDYAAGRSGQYSLPVWDNVEGIGVDLDWYEVFPAFLAANTVMDYDEQSVFSGIDIHDSVTTLPDSGESTSSDEPESLGQNYIRFDDGLDEGRDLHVTFQGEAGPDEWFAVLVSTEDRRVVETVRLELDENHQGEGWIAFQGGDVFLVVAPWDESASGYHYNWDNAQSWSYSWQAELGDESDPDDPGDTDDTGYDKVDDLPETPGDDLGGVGMPGCGCATGGGAAGGALLAMLAVVGLARRRD
jgi:MYXO-CTERM domain-containing protein